MSDTSLNEESADARERPDLQAEDQMSRAELRDKLAPAGDGVYPDPLLEHDYDGIREFDNPIPGWFNVLFYGSIIWGLFYIVAINLGYIDHYQEDLAERRGDILALRDNFTEDVPPVTDELLAEVEGDAEAIASGQAVYATNCAACHGQRGEGLIGPNLTDSAWIHGGTASEVWQVIEVGAPAKGMPAWGPVLQRQDQLAVYAWVRSVAGKNIAGKPPEGTPMQ